jgi:AraC family transcriptional regulator
VSVMAKRRILRKRIQYISRLPSEPSSWGVRDRNRPAIIKNIKSNSLAATRCRLDGPFDEKTHPLPSEDAYMVTIQVRGTNARELWLDGKSVKTEPLHAGGVVFHDLRRSPQFYFYDTLDSAHYFLSRKTLDNIADDAEAPRISDLQFTPGIGVMDQVVKELTRLILPGFDKPDRVSQLFADYISLALGSHIAQTYGGMKSVVALRRGGLAAWKERRAKELMSANLHGDFCTRDLARECSLSAGHFARAFRHSTGLSPHQWLLQCRIDKAHALLRDARLSLAEIAGACGFADQSHFTKAYTRLRGITPGAWRRQQEIRPK